MKNKILEEKAIELYINKRYNMMEISKELNIPRTTLGRAFKQRGIETHKFGKVTKLTEDEINQIILLRQKRISIASIAKKYNLYPLALNKLLEEYGIAETTKLNKYSFDYDFFSNINTKTKAMLLGLFYSDGYNCEEIGYVSLKLAIRDLDTVENVKKILNSDHPIHISEIDEENRQDQCRIILYNRKFSNDLAKLGCVQAKSLIKKFPKLKEPEIIKSFIYGYFLGNGWITYAKVNGFREYDIGIVSTEDMLKGIKEFIGLNGFYCSICRTKHDDNYPMKQLSIGGNLQIVKFLDWFFSNELHIMKRKYDLYLEVINYLANPIRELQI